MDAKRCTQCGKIKTFAEFKNDKRKKSGLAAECRRCHQDRWLRWEREHKPWAAKRQRAFQRRLRTEVLAAYGGKCVCCGEQEPVFLVLDHVHDDGAQQRKVYRTTGQIYSWARRNGFPDSLQILCHNCNFAKRMGGCPHSRVGEVLD